MATQAGLDRVKAINATIAKQGQAAPNPMGGGNAVTLQNQGAANVADRYSSSAVPGEKTAAEIANPTQPLTPQNTPNSIDPTLNPTPGAVAPAFNVPSSTQATPEQVKAVAAATQQVNDLASKYKAGLATTAGTPVPANQGQAMAAVGNALPQLAPESPSIVGNIMETDSNFDTILTAFDEFMSPLSQRKSLLDEYKGLSKDLGIEGMNAELINAKKVIDGTEDDIRSEIAAVGGLGTDSQVQALANARNKSLVKNYNYLLESRDSAMTQLNTMMNLSAQDRQMAEAEWDRKMGFAFKVAEFKERAVNNSRDNYNNIVKAVGYSGLLAATNGNPYEQSLIEKTLGLARGGLQDLASIPQPIETQTVSYGDGEALVNSQTGEILKVYPGKTLNTGSGSGGGSLLTPEQTSKASSNINQINTLLNDPNLSKVTGLAAYNPLNRIPGSEVNYTRTQLNQLKSIISLDSRQSLKGSGAISDFEFKVLGEASTALDKNLSLKDTKRELNKIKGVFNLMGGQPTTVKVTDPNSNRTKSGILDRATMEDAVKQGFIIEFE